jgi:hypothetical protein
MDERSELTKKATKGQGKVEGFFFPTVYSPVCYKCIRSQATRWCQQVELVYQHRQGLKTRLKATLIGCLLLGGLAQQVAMCHVAWAQHFGGSELQKKKEREAGRNDARDRE